MNRTITTLFLISGLHLATLHVFGQAIWTQYNGPFGGEISSFATYGDTLFCGSTMTGVFKSVDGKTWLPAFPELTYIHSLHTHNNALFVGSDKLYRYDVSGLVPVSQQMQGVILNMHTFNGQLFVVSDQGVYQYNPTTHMLILKNNGAPSLIEDLTSVDNVLFCTGRAHGLFKSTDAGEHWNMVNIPGYTYGIFDMIARGDSLICSAYKAIFVSTDKGNTWSDIKPNLFYSNFARVQAGGNRLITVGTFEGTYELSDGATQWVKITDQEFDALGYQGKTFFGSDKFGLYRLDSQVHDFTFSNAGINTGRVNEIELFDSKLYAATHGGVHYTSTDGDDWVVVSEIQGIFSMTVGKKDTTLFAGTAEGLFMTTVNSSNWSKSENGLSSPPVWDIESLSDRVFIGTDNGVYVSYTNGKSWKLLPNAASPDVTQMSYIGANDSILVAGNSTGLYRILSDSSDWVAIPFFKNREVYEAHVIDGVIYASGSGKGVCRSIDNGNTWTTVNIPTFSDFDMIKRGDNIYVATYDKIFYSSDNGSSWNSFYETGIRDITITCITEGDSAFYAGTYGKSIWRRPFLATTDISSNVYAITDSVIYNVEAGTSIEDFKQNIIPGYGTSLEFDNEDSSSGRKQTGDALLVDDKIMIIAEDGSNMRVLRVSSETLITLVDEEHQADLQAYPVPTVDRLYVQYPGKIKSYVVQNSAGQKMAVAKHGDCLDVSELAKGLYLLTIQLVNNQRKVIRFTKE
ncbi:MAG TPA: hypothetical protein VGK59_11015 [Ohtaekwangia sp.]